MQRNTVPRRSEMDKWYFGPVYKAAEAGLTTGKGDNFDPNGKLTRAEVATFLYRAAGSPDVSRRDHSPSRRSDVPDSLGDQEREEGHAGEEQLRDHFTVSDKRRLTWL